MTFGVCVLHRAVGMDVRVGLDRRDVRIVIVIVVTVVVAMRVFVDQFVMAVQGCHRGA